MQWNPFYALAVISHLDSGARIAERNLAAHRAGALRIADCRNQEWNSHCFAYVACDIRQPILLNGAAASSRGNCVFSDRPRNIDSDHWPSAPRRQTQRANKGSWCVKPQSILGRFILEISPVTIVQLVNYLRKTVGSGRSHLRRQLCEDRKP